jgi:mono/diheme cytochrome c family protein
MLAVVLIGMAVVGLAAWGFARPAVASAERARSEGKSFGARHKADGKLHRLAGEHAFSRAEGRDEESDDHESDDRESDESESDESGGSPTGGLTTTTIAEAGAGATTTTTGATTTTTQAPATTTTTQAPATTTTTAINAASLFASLCARCHSPSGTQIRSSLTAVQISPYLDTGGSMSSYASSLDAAQKSALATYVAGGGR